MNDDKFFKCWFIIVAVSALVMAGVITWATIELVTAMSGWLNK